MRQTVRKIMLIAAMASAGLAACDDSDDDTTSNTGNVGAGRDGGARGDGGASGGGGDVSGGGTDSGGNGSSDGEDSDADAGSGLDGDASGDDGGAAQDGASAGDAADAAPEVELSDPEIGAVITAANTGEVAQANAALRKLTDPDATAFAQEMIVAHMAVQMRQAMLLQSKGITPVENEVSMELRREADAIVAELTAATTEVNVLYMETQVTVHEKVLETLDATLIPSAEDADLRAELEATRVDVKAHLDHAQEILEALQG
jgi:putative membrane protein